MRILIVDYLSVKGHRVFNKIHIECLINLGNSVDLIGRKGQFENIDCNKLSRETIIPEKYFRNYPMPILTSRLTAIASLLWIKKSIKYEKYDLVIFITYDIASLFCLRIKGNVVLINHNNVWLLKKKINIFLTKLLPSNYLHIVLNEEMQNRLRILIPKAKVFVIPHGFLEPSRNILRPPFIMENERFIFCPVNAHYNRKLLFDLCKNKDINCYLKRNSISFYIKKKIINESKGKVFVIDNRLEDCEYDYMIQKAVAVVLPYGPDFRYRCSGILYEAIASDTPIIASGIPSLLLYKNSVNVRFFNNAESFINCLDDILTGSFFSINKNSLLPQKYWSAFLSSLQ